MSYKHGTRTGLEELSLPLLHFNDILEKGSFFFTAQTFHYLYFCFVCAVLGGNGREILRIISGLFQSVDLVKLMSIKTTESFYR